MPLYDGNWENKTPLFAHEGKVAAITDVSPSGLSGLRGLVPLSMIFGNIGSPPSISLCKPHRR